MFTRRLGVTPSMQDLIQKLAAAQRPMSLNEYLNEHLPSDIHKKTPEDQTAIAKQLALRYETEKPKVDVVTQTTVSPAEQYIRERIKTKTEMADPSWGKSPEESQKPRGVESWGPPPDQRPAPIPPSGGSSNQDRSSLSKVVPPVPKRTPLSEQSDKPQLKFDFGDTALFPESEYRKENPEAGTGGTVDFPKIPSRQLSQSEIDKYVREQLEYVPQVSDPERRYIHRDDIARGKRLHEYLKDTVGNEEGISKLLPYNKTPYSIIDAAREAKTPEDLQKIQEAFDQHKEKRRQFIHTPTLEVSDPDPRVVAWHESKRLAELGVPIDAPFTVKNKETSVEPGHADAARMLMTNEFHAQKAIDAKQKEFLLKDPDVISVQEAKEREDKAKAEGYTQASEAHQKATASVLEGRDAKAEQARNLHEAQLEAEKLKANAARMNALDASINTRNHRMGAMLAQAGLSPSVLEQIEEQPGVAMEDNSVFRNLFKGEYGKTPTLKDFDITPSGELSHLAPKLLPPVLPKELPKVPSSDAPIFKEHLGVSQTMQPHEELLKTHANQGAVNKVQEALKDLRSFRDAHLNPTPAPVHTPPSSWGDRFWKGVEGIGDMIPGIHEGSNKYLRRAAGIALPIGVAGGTAYLANRFLNRNKEEPANNDEHQPEEDRPPQKKVASLAMFQGAYVR